MMHPERVPEYREDSLRLDDSVLADMVKEAGKAGKLPDEELDARFGAMFSTQRPSSEDEQIAAPQIAVGYLAVPLEEEELLIIAAQIKRDGDAFTTLYRRHWRKLWGWCYGVLRNREDAEDTALDAVVKAWESLPKFGRRTSFVTWLSRIGYNACLDRLRRRERRRAIEIEAVPLDMPIEDSEGEQTTLGDLLPDLSREDPAEVATVVTAFEKCWDGLAPEERALLLGVYQGFLTFKDVGRMRGVKETAWHNSGKHRVARALEHLEEQLKGQGVHLEPTRVIRLLREQTVEEGEQSHNARNTQKEESSDETLES